MKNGGYRCVINCFFENAPCRGLLADRTPLRRLAKPVGCHLNIAARNVIAEQWLTSAFSASGEMSALSATVM